MSNSTIPHGGVKSRCYSCGDTLHHNSHSAKALSLCYGCSGLADRSPPGAPNDDEDTPVAKRYDSRNLPGVTW
jgi:hypothetical protein